MVGEILALALRDEHLGGHTTRLIQLLDRYGPTELDRAIAEALSRGSPSAASVAHLLDQWARARKAPPPLDPVLPADPLVRDLRGHAARPPTLRRALRRRGRRLPRLS